MNLLIKDFPDELADALEERAKQFRPPTTRNALLLTVLEDYLGEKSGSLKQNPTREPAGKEAA